MTQQEPHAVDHPYPEVVIRTGYEPLWGLPDCPLCGQSSWAHDTILIRLEGTAPDMASQQEPKVIPDDAQPSPRVVGALRIDRSVSQQEPGDPDGFVPIPFKNIVMEWEGQKAEIADLASRLHQAEEALREERSK